MSSEKKINRYGNIDGLRTLSCFGIIAMHVQANTNYQISGFSWDVFIPSLTWLVYLFIMISGFGMCAGYLEKFQFGNVDLEQFYKKRYLKILPFFSLLILLALIIEPSITNLYEASIEMMLLHGLLPNNELNVLGVCWTLGVIFLFYLLFPAFSVIVKTKKRAWISLILSLWINYICEVYFFGERFVNALFTPRHSFLYCLPLFVGGAIIYLYRDVFRKICLKYRYVCLGICSIYTVVWYMLPMKYEVQQGFLLTFILFFLWLSYFVGADSKIMDNKIMNYFSGVSMEMYLAHMVVFRVLEKAGILDVFGSNWSSYLIVCVAVVIGLVSFIGAYRTFIRIIEKRFKRYEKV